MFSATFKQKLVSYHSMYVQVYVQLYLIRCLVFCDSAALSEHSFLKKYNGHIIAHLWYWASLWVQNVIYDLLPPWITIWNVGYYSIHVLGWLLKWLNFITAHSSVDNKPGSVTWLATKYLKTVSRRNHTEKLTTAWPQNISFWPKIYISSSYFTISMLNCSENTLKLPFDSYVTAVKFLTYLIFKTSLDLIPTLVESI